MAGDTIYAEVRQQRPPRRRHRIHLHRIDAPENPQPYNPDAAQCLDNTIARSSRLFAYVTCESAPHGRPIAIPHHVVINDSRQERRK